MVNDYLFLVGPSHLSPTFFDPLAQLAERGPFKPIVVGSSPTWISSRSYS